MANNEKSNCEKISKNIYKSQTSKGNKEVIFCTNLDVDFFKNKKINEYNSKYFMQKNVVREYFNDKERRYLSEIEFNDEKIKSIKEIDILKIRHHKRIVKEYINEVKEYCNELNLFFLDPIKATTSYRLIVGLGNPSVTETSMTLHNIYGIPYIPGQALKGIARSYFLQKYYDIEQNKFDDIECNNKKINSKNLYKNIFGDDFNGEDNEKGNVIFFDSFPISEEITIEKDVMTPHYGSYYGDEENPTDVFSTNPIPFYTIKDTKFNFMFAIRKDKIDSNEKEYINLESISKFISELIKEALEEHGVGAKTSVGYGYFDIIKEKQQGKEKFLKECKNDIQDEINKISKMSDKNKKREAIMDIYENVNDLERKQKEQLSKYMKECF